MCPKTSKWPCSKMVSPYPLSKIPCPVPGADFFEPGSKIPLPRSPRADFFEPGSRNPRARSALGAPPKAAPGGFFERVSKKSALGGRGEGRRPPKIAQIPCSAGVTIWWVFLPFHVRRLLWSRVPNLSEKHGSKSNREPPNLNRTSCEARGGSL